jgi:hypothetical protein
VDRPALERRRHVVRWCEIDPENERAASGRLRRHVARGRRRRHRAQLAGARSTRRCCARRSASAASCTTSNAIAFGETLYGGARGVRDVLCVYVGTGVGAGVVIGGRLYAGATHLGGEIGHTKVVPAGRLCGCGMRGCLEAYASGYHIQKRA